MPSIPAIGKINDSSKVRIALVQGQLIISAPFDAISDVIIDGNLKAFDGLVGAADKLPYFTGTDTMALTNFTVAARNLLDDTSADAMLTTLGGGAVGKAALAGATRGAFLTGAGVLYSLGLIAPDAAASVTLGNAFEGSIIGFDGGSAAIAGLFACRINTSLNGAAALALSSAGLANFYSGVLTGTTGASGALNFGGGDDGKLYVENRRSTAVNINLFVLKRSG